MSRVHDAAVVGGGPAGLAFACAAAARGLDVVVLEKREGALDKACGEGLLPAGRRALEALGAAALVDPGARWPIEELRWIDADGVAATARLPGGGGLGIRRTALSAALRARAAAGGAAVRTGVAVTEHRRAGDRIAAVTATGERVEARVLVAADGLASPVRRRERLDVPAVGPPRFGLRRHYRLAPWAAAVEVHFTEGVEAYVTPVGPAQVGVAFLFERAAIARPSTGSGRADIPSALGGLLPTAAGSSAHGEPVPPGHGEPVSPARGEPSPEPVEGSGEPRAHVFDRLLARFPALQARLAGAPAITEPRGAGPLARRARARIADRLVLLGDAAGYLDAVTGEGLSLAFGCAMDLAALLPDAIARGAGAAALGGYERAWARRYRVYAGWTALMLQLARHGGLRRAALRAARAWPGGFAGIVGAAVG